MNAAHARFEAMENALQERVNRLEKEKNQLIADYNDAITTKEDEASQTKIELSAWKLEMQNALATFGQMARSFGMNSDAANEFSVEMVKVAGDLFQIPPPYLVGLGDRGQEPDRPEHQHRSPEDPRPAVVDLMGKAAPHGDGHQRRHHHLTPR